MRNMIQFYVASMEANRTFLPSTSSTVTEKLERIFDELESYGVKMEDKEITGLDGEVLQQWFNSHARQWKPATANSYVCTVNKFLRWASTMSSRGKSYIDDDYSHILHTQKIPSIDSLPEEERPKDKYYTDEEVEELLYGVHGRNVVRDRAIIGLFLYSGLRVSELCSLTIGQVLDRPRGIVYVQRKGGAWKDVPVSEKFYPLLDAYLKTRKDRNDHSRPLFMTSHGEPCNRNQIYKCISFKQKEMGLATGPHALRHTCISKIANTVGVAAARDQANHASITITNRYVHTGTKEHNAAVAALNW